MTEDPELALLSMADIARLAGQSRATVGNWKIRETDFPAPHSRGPRGPLYERAVVLTWLTEKGRLAKGAPSESRLFQLVHGMAQHQRGEGLYVAMLVAALRHLMEEADFEELASAQPEHMEARVRRAIDTWFPYAAELMPRDPLPDRGISEIMEAIAEGPPENARTVFEAMLYSWTQIQDTIGPNYSTPEAVRSVISALVGGGLTYDPAMGTGATLVELAENPAVDLPVFGQESDRMAWALAKLRCLVHGIEAEFQLGDVLTYDRFLDVRFDTIVCDPPWNMRIPDAATSAADPRWVWGEPSPMDANMAWVQHCLYHLNDGGRAILVLPPGAAFAKGRNSRVLQGIIKSGYLDAVISLPSGLYASTSIACNVLVFVKGRATDKGKPASTLMVNLEDAELEPTRPEKSLPEQAIEELHELYWGQRVAGEISSPIASLVPYDELVENGFDASPRRYVRPPRHRVGRDELLARRKELAVELATALGECDEADAHLTRLIKGDPQ